VAWGEEVWEVWEVWTTKVSDSSFSATAEVAIAHTTFSLLQEEET
jgi:hypothetical protein